MTNDTDIDLPITGWQLTPEDAHNMLARSLDAMHQRAAQEARNQLDSGDPLDELLHDFLEMAGEFQAVLTPAGRTVVDLTGEARVALHNEWIQLAKDNVWELTDAGEAALNRSWDAIDRQSTAEIVDPAALADVIAQGYVRAQRHPDRPLSIYRVSRVLAVIAIPLLLVLLAVIFF